MATLKEIYDARNDQPLRQRFAAAVWIKAGAVLADEQAGDARKALARDLGRREPTENEHLSLVRRLAGEAGSAGGKSTDEVIQRAVDAWFDDLATPRQEP